MKYIQPATGQYESALRAESLYSIVEGFLQDIPHSKIEEAIKSKVGPKAIWDLEPMNSNLREFVVSYLVGSFREQMPELEGILLSPTEKWENLESYTDNLEQRYTPDTGVREMVEFSRRQFKRIVPRLKSEISEIKKLKDKDRRFQDVAHDFFGHLYTFYVGKLGDFFDEVTGRRHY